MRIAGVGDGRFQFDLGAATDGLPLSDDRDDRRTVRVRGLLGPDGPVMVTAKLSVKLPLSVTITVSVYDFRPVTWSGAVHVGFWIAALEKSHR